MTSSICSRTAAALVVALLAAPVLVAQDPGTEPAMMGNWSGTFRPGTMTGSRMSEGGAPGRYSGRVDITPSKAGINGVYRVDLRISSSGGNGSETLEWGISHGRCGSKLIMVAGTNQLPTLEMRTGGVGDLSDEVRMALESKAGYQVVLFRGGHEQQSVVACANMKFGDKGK